MCNTKGFVVSSGYVGEVPGMDKGMIFPTEEEYREYMKELTQLKEDLGLEVKS